MRRLYYALKPFIPRAVQVHLRRALVRSRRAGLAGVWPIDDRAKSPPEAWEGWPNGHRFALVLTHDVDTARGHERARDLSCREERLGFRSSFNFVPERYSVSPRLRKDLTARGFEVGVHGLLHDGRLFESEAIFSERAVRINRYLREWGAVGFRAPSMIRKLDWIRRLDIEYDASTFDTDPFEPQPEGAATIFPFWMPEGEGRPGFVELPYTLPQDFTLFILMGEPDVSIWCRKLDWVASHGGMALLNSHPDYMRFDGGRRGLEEYPVRLYEEFLTYARDRYGAETWMALPREVSAFWRHRTGALPETSRVR